MSKFKVDIPGIDTNNLKVLTNDEMMELFKRKSSGDELAKDAIVNGNLKLVLSIISKFRNKDIDMNDLFQVGCIGLIKAVDNFDASYGVMFSTYAVPLILGEVKRLIRTNTSIRVARSIRDTAYKVLKFKEEYSNLYGVEPNNKTIAKSLGIEEYEIRDALEALQDPVSIFEPIYNDGGDTIYLLDQLGEAKKPYLKEDTIALKDALNKIKKRERDILVGRYIIGKTQSEIAEDLGVSQAQISRIESNAIKNMRKLLE
ncbi:MAG TPA: RNA polymerase sigma-G factor [Firmicutes bacterium]|nr:RNA polymerase sigma-G factor [Bacillota bacterium]